MKILVLYGTVEGQTRKIATFVADKLREMDETVTLKDATTVEWDFWLREFDAAIIAASVHTGAYQSSVVSFAKCHYEALNQMPSLFLSVSLSAAAPQDAEGMKDLNRCVEAFVRETGWKADVKHVAGAFRFAEYDFFKRFVMRLVAWEKNVKGSGTASELELTDWNEVQKIAATFCESARRSKQGSSAS